MQYGKQKTYSYHLRKSGITDSTVSKDIPQETSKARSKEAPPMGWAKERIGSMGLLLCGPEQRVVTRDEVKGSRSKKR